MENKMNLATFVDTPVFGTLGAPEDMDLKAWEKYLRAIRNQTVHSWNLARGAYLALEEVREAFGLPLVVEGEAASIPGGALTSAQNQDFLELAALNVFLAEIMDDVLSERRRFGYVEDSEDLGIELLDSDRVMVGVVNNSPRLVGVSSGDPVPVSGTIGIHPAVIIGGFLAASLVATYFIVDSANQKAKAVAEQKTLQTVAEAQKAMVVSGKATPEEAKKMTDAIFTGATQLEEARGKSEEGRSDIPKTLVTVGWLAVGVAGLFFLSKTIPPLLRR